MATRNELGPIQTFREGIAGLPLSHLWRGAGSAIFMEFGSLTPRTRKRQDGTSGNPRGEFGLMIEWSWRIENATSILCGSWSEEPLWQPTFDLLRGKKVIEVTTFGRLPEITISLTENFHVSSFMTAEGDPKWVLFDRRADVVRWLNVREGSLQIEESHQRNTRNEKP